MSASGLGDGGKLSRGSSKRASYEAKLNEEVILTHLWRVKRDDIRFRHRLSWHVELVQGGGRPATLLRWPLLCADTSRIQPFLWVGFPAWEGVAVLIFHFSSPGVLTGVCSSVFWLLPLSSYT